MPKALSKQSQVLTANATTYFEKEVAHGGPLLPLKAVREGSIMALLDIDYLVEEYGDPRTRHWFLMSSPWPTVTFVVIYLLTVKVFLPAYMKNRKPYNLTKVLFYYNLFQVVFSAYLTYMGFFCGFVRRYSLFACRDVDRSPDDPDAMMAATGMYYYFIAKFTEFLDTIFFVLRKKDNQISLLHLYHHATMPINAWIATLVVPGGHTSQGYALNSSVHVVMYTYYLLSGLGPQWQKYLWWKKYLTTFQIVQFSYGMVYMVIIYFTRDQCPEITEKLTPLVSYAGIYIGSLLFLFTQFYFSTYNTPTKTAKKNSNGVKYEKSKIHSIIQENTNALSMKRTGGQKID